MDWELFWIIRQSCRRQSCHCNNISFCPKLILNSLAAAIQLLQTVKSVLRSQHVLLTPCKATLHSIYFKVWVYTDQFVIFQQFLSREMQMVLFKFEMKDKIVLIMITLQTPYPSVRDYFRFHDCVHWFNGIQSKSTPFVSDWRGNSSKSLEQIKALSWPKWVISCSFFCRIARR